MTAGILPGMARAESGRKKRWSFLRVDDPLLVAVFVALAVGIRLVFWLYTGRIWEDALITIQHARNLVAGLGFTHHPSEGHVHGFTSALSVLIPLLGEFFGRGVLAMRLASLVAAAVGIVYAARIAAELKMGTIGLFFVLAYLAFDENQIFYGMAGMETQVAVAVLLAGLYYTLVADPIRLGACCGLGLLARPDFVLWIAPALIVLSTRSLRTAGKATAVCAAIVSPWLLFTTLYYGSPVPHTILAKKASYINRPPVDLLHPAPLVHWLAGRFIEHKDFWHKFTPFLGNDFIVATPVPEAIQAAIAAITIGLCLIGFWSVRSRRLFYPAIAFVLAFVAYRVLFLLPGYFGWYVVPFMAVVALGVGLGIQSLIDRGWPRLAASAGSIALSAAFAMHVPFTFPLEKTVQVSLEDGVRRKVGEYLAGVVGKDEAVVCESLGYFGWYSHATIYDWPGLASPKALHALMQLPPGGRGLLALVDAMKAEWVVIRPYELDGLRKMYPRTASLYREAARFTASPGSVDLTRWGVAMFSIDTDFIVLRRSDPSAGLVR